MAYSDKKLNSEASRDQINLIPQVRKSPLLLYGIFLHILQKYYSKSDNLIAGIKYRWVPENELRKTKEKVVVIRPDYSEISEAIENRPGIVVKIGNINYSNLDGSATTGSPGVDMNLEEGEYEYAREGKCPISFDHIGSTKGEALLFATCTQDFIDAFSDMIKSDFCFTGFGVTTFTAAKKSKDYKDKYVSTIVADLVFQDVWSLKAETPKLKTINMVIRDWSEREPEDCINKALNCC